MMKVGWWVGILKKVSYRLELEILNLTKVWKILQKELWSPWTAY